MTTTAYEEDRDLSEMVDKILSCEEISEFNLCRERSIKVVCCMCTCQDENEEVLIRKSSPVKLKKLSDAERLFMAGQPHYLLVMDCGFWQAASRKRQWATLLDTLLDIKVVVKDGAMTLKKQATDVPINHTATLAYLGAFDELCSVLRDCFTSDHRLIEFVNGSNQPDSDPESNPELEGEPSVETDSDTNPEADSESNPPPAKAPSRRHLKSS